ncbi:hypothetical protein [Candidatus Entotheonella palauensis]|uniref:hypothetical protein n=1 Tax=Candidatus Entotheonella palauensis TaxID=93172 RepID=UPI000B7F84F7|nr:hypothetical protein [Candidatus Entotheonella palauensis]
MTQFKIFLYAFGPAVGVFLIYIILLPLYTPKRFVTAKDTPKKQSEALHALMNWSKWIISIETGLVSIIIAILKNEFSYSPLFLYAALISFVLSIILATALIGTVPGALEAVPIFDESISQDRKRASIYMHKFLGIVPIWWLAGMEHTYFIVGIILGSIGMLSGFP